VGRETLRRVSEDAMEIADCTTACPGCGAVVPDVEAPVHAYVPSAAGCWLTFGEVQADEALRFGYPPTHRVVVDAWMAQHPGDGSDRRERQSLFLHLVGLCALLVQEIPAAHATRAFSRLLRRREDFPILHGGPDRGELTILDLAKACDLADYDRRARDWGRIVWETWRPQHPLIQEALDEVL